MVSVILNIGYILNYLILHASMLVLQDLVQQIARQRDMFRRLLQDAASVPGRAGGAADLQLIASADAQLANNSALQVELMDCPR